MYGTVGVMLVAIILFVVGIAILVKGADWLVDGSSVLARKIGVSDLAIGLTIVAFGTSMPELTVNIFASIQGNADIAIGNIVGSNIANILLILGATALIAPLQVQRSTVIKEIPFSLLAAAMLFIMANDAIVDGLSFSALTRSDGMALMGFFLIFLYYTFGLQHRDEEPLEKHRYGAGTATLFVFIGLAALIGGGKIVVDSAVSMARSIGVSETLIGLTVVAIGTSLPELATSAVAAYRGKADIAVGNIVGSNVFNVFWILGVSAIIRPIPFTPAVNPDLGMVVFATVLLFFVIHNGFLYRRLILWWKQYQDYRIRRWEGGILLGTYVAYIAFIVWRG